MANTRREKCDRNQFLISISSRISSISLLLAIETRKVQNQQTNNENKKRKAHRHKCKKTNNKLLIEAMRSPHILWCIKLVRRCAARRQNFIAWDISSAKYRSVSAVSGISSTATVASAAELCSRRYRQWYSIVWRVLSRVRDSASKCM